MSSVDHHQSSAPAQGKSPPGNPEANPARTETRTCASCEGEGYVPLDHRYDPRSGLLTIVGGPCSCCRGTGELVVYLYRTGNPGGGA